MASRDANSTPVHPTRVKLPIGLTIEPDYKRNAAKVVDVNEILQSLCHLVREFRTAAGSCCGKWEDVQRVPIRLEEAVFRSYNARCAIRSQIPTLMQHKVTLPCERFLISSVHV